MRTLVSLRKFQRFRSSLPGTREKDQTVLYYTTQQGIKQVIFIAKMVARWKDEWLLLELKEASAHSFCSLVSSQLLVCAFQHWLHPPEEGFLVVSSWVFLGPRSFRSIRETGQLWAALPGYSSPRAAAETVGGCTQPVTLWSPFSNPDTTLESWLKIMFPF